MTQTFSESFLANRLVPIGGWNPYPRYDEREAWQAVPQDIHTIYVDRGRKVQSEGWSVLTATEFLEFKRTGNGSADAQDKFRRRNHLLRLVLAECLEGKGHFLGDIANGVWLTCEESFWDHSAAVAGGRSGPGLPDVTYPTVRLFVAETGSLLAWTKYLLAPQLDKISPMIVKRIHLEVKRRVLRPALERDLWWMGLDGKPRELGNWNPWINSNLLFMNLLLEDDAKIRLEAIVKITKSLDAYLNVYSPDGGCREGSRYWNRSPASYFQCVNTLQSATGHASHIFSHPFLDQMGRYIANIHIANDYYVNFGDADPKEHPPGDLIYRYGNAVGDRQLATFGAYRAHRIGMAATGAGLAAKVDAKRPIPSISRYLPAVLEAEKVRHAPQADSLVRDVWYPDLGLMAARETAGSANGMYLAAQAASNGRHHGHNDSGSFIFYYNGEPVVIDVGVGTYTAKTFSEERYSIWTMQSAYHNLPTVGGVMQHEGDSYQARVMAYHASDRRAELTLNLAPAYPKEAGIQYWKRRLTLDREKGTVLLEENFQLTRPVPVSLTIMTPGAPVAESRGKLSLRSIAGEGTPVTLRYDDATIYPDVEKISLTDPKLTDSWGSQVYRLLLNSKQPVQQGTWSFHFHDNGREARRRPSKGA